MGLHDEQHNDRERPRRHGPMDRYAGSERQHGGQDLGDRDYAPGYGGSGAYGARDVHDPDYRHWREQQLRQLDQTYDAWRGERYKKFSDEFDAWRKNRSSKMPANAKSSSSGSSATTGSSATSSQSGGSASK